MSVRAPERLVGIGDCQQKEEVLTWAIRHWYVYLAAFAIGLLSAYLIWG